MESSTSPTPAGTCPYTVTVRRNPPRRARATPSTAIAAATPASCSSKPQNRRDIAPIRLEEILDDVVIHVPLLEVAPPIPQEEEVVSENLRVFLRIRPLEVVKTTSKNGNNGNRARIKGISPKKERTTKTDNALKKKSNTKKTETCLVVKDSRSVKLLPPASLQDSKRIKTQVYDGFNHVFESGSLQEEVYEKVMEPLVSDFLRGKSGMLAAMGSSGSGKTHTIFGCPREPGIVSLTLRRLYHHIDTNSSEFSRSYFISMFEIYSERGKGEKIFDLTSDGAELSLQQSAIKGLQEIMVSDITEAECAIARGMLKRATAMTNTNSQSSRSQCIINIRSFLKKIDDDKAEVRAKNAVLTIVDLAGAEREKRTGNQGARLLESNFINNTSMVFGLCLRSLLEHQKNPKKPLQKHFQNSLLTRYLRDYLEGKKRMTLILTVKPGEDDYLDTTYLLRQASPYMKIKFNDVEEPSHLLGQKRHIQALPRIEQSKRKKFRNKDASMIDEGDGVGDVHSVLQEEVILEQFQEPEPLEVSGSSPSHLKIKCNGCKFLKEEYCIELVKRDRNDQIMRNFSKALWDVLKQYKKKLEASENETHNLKESLQKEKFRISELEKELNDQKNCHSCCTQNSTGFSIPILCTDTNSDTVVCLQPEQCEPKNNYKVHTEASAPKLEVPECSNTSNLCDAVVCKSPKMSPQVHDEAFSPKSEVPECISTSNLCDVIVCKTTELSPQVHAETFAPEPEFPECSNTSNLCEAVVCKSPKMSLQGPKDEAKHRFSNAPSSVEKPRRRLGPPPSLLLKDISNLDLGDDNKPKGKGSRGGRKPVTTGKALTQGSISLLKLLGNYHNV
ncbi:hypothetical protein NE237_023993 [Protea cynaroides]|uniref:Kinesin motor domain-containing protein n=1 Tax=Protea cynaroides TaxID=273540 RepID=A0A9Q0K502_9MAGN|nr:hypothetical protein NE237_023993 [Protea cynaroides]